jgi:bacterioferritin-associated ferredoxin
MVVCICHRVSDRDIARAARSGCVSFDELQDELRIATACGACRECAQQMLESHHRACPRRVLQQPVAEASA